MTTNFIETKDGTKIFYKDWGTGQPILFSHGWPLSGDAWSVQMLFFAEQGYRVIAHDRRGLKRRDDFATKQVEHQLARIGAELVRAGARRSGVCHCVSY